MIERLKAFAGRKFVRDTLMLQMGSVVTSLTYLATSVLTARSLGQEVLGRWATSRELYMMLFLLVTMGLTNAAVTLYSKAKGARDRRASVDALAALVKLGAIVSLLVVVVGLFVLPDAAEYYFEDREIGLVARILCLAAVGELLRGLTLAVLAGTRQMGRYARFDASTNIIRVALVGAALLIDRSPRAVAWAFVAHSVITGILGLWAYARARRDLSEELAPPPFAEVLAAVPRASLRALLGISVLLAMTKAMSVVVPRLGMLFIPALALVSSEGFEANGAYQVGNVLTLVLTGAIGAIGSNVLPTLGAQMGATEVPLAARGAMLRRLSLTAGSFAVLMTLLSVPCVWLVIRYVYGAEFHDAFEFYLLLASGNLFLGFAVIVEPFYIYAKRLKVHVAQTFVYASLAAAGIFLATREFGPKGGAAAGGLCRVFVVCHLVYIWLYFRKHGHEAPNAVATAAPDTDPGRPSP